MNAIQEINALVKMAWGSSADKPKGPTLGKPEWRSLPPAITNIADEVGTDTKNVQVPAFSYDDTDSAIAYDILRSPEVGELFSKRKGEYFLDWGPARDAVEAVSPEFAKEMFSWKSLRNLARIKETFSKMDPAAAAASMDQVLSWADANPNHKKILVGAVKSRNEQAAKVYPNKKYPDLKFPTWAERRAARMQANGGRPQTPATAAPAVAPATVPSTAASPKTGQ